MERVSEDQPRPWELDARTVCYYSHTKKDFVDEYGEKTAMAMHRKAVKFLELGLVQYKDGVFQCLPIPGYNTRTYTLRKRPGVPGGVADQFECNCQGYQSKLKKGVRPGCSHTLALSYYFKTGRRGS